MAENHSLPVVSEPYRHRGCPKMREGRRGRFEDLDYFCESYRTIFQIAVPRLRTEVEAITGRPALPV